MNTLLPIVTHKFLIFVSISIGMYYCEVRLFFVNEIYRKQVSQKVTMYRSFLQNYNLDTAIIKFDPCISIIDRYDHYRYNDFELFPLIAKVATKFTKIFIQISEIDLIEGKQCIKIHLKTCVNCVKC